MDPLTFQDSVVDSVLWQSGLGKPSFSGFKMTIAMLYLEDKGPHTL